MKQETADSDCDSENREVVDGAVVVCVSATMEAVELHLPMLVKTV
jgi:hypothetical protein